MRSLIAGLALVLAIAVPRAFAAEGPEAPPPQLAEILEHADRGDPLGPEQLDLIDRFARGHLLRARGTTLEDAQFSLAQLLAQAGRGEEAVEALKKLAASSKNPDVQSAALYDVGKVCWVALNDVRKAAEAFQKVTGRFESLAKRDLLRMYERAGQVGKSVEVLQAAVAAAKDKGEKLGLLRQLGELCRRIGRTEDAIAAYKQIADDFTEKDVDELRAAATKRVRDAFDKGLALQAENRWREADQLLGDLKMWVGALAAAARLDEFQAAQEEFDVCRRKAEELDRKRNEARDKEREKGRGEPPPK